jgi:hypothetical protein
LHEDTRQIRFILEEVLAFAKRQEELASKQTNDSHSGDKRYRPLANFLINSTTSGQLALFLLQDQKKMSLALFRIICYAAEE